MFLLAAGLMLSPVFHRVLHRFHWKRNKFAIVDWRELRHSRLRYFCEAAEFDIGERGEHDVADDLQALLADVFEVVLRRVPVAGVVVQIDEVDRGTPAFRKGT